jgi:hypothetical protein
MVATNVDALSPAKREPYAAIVERMRQLRRRSGAPDGGGTGEEAVALHMVSAEEVARARWGDPGLPAPAPPSTERDGFHPT